MRAYTQYKGFIGTEEELNEFLRKGQSDQHVSVVSIHKLRDLMDGLNEYEVVFHITPMSEGRPEAQ